MSFRAYATHDAAIFTEGPVRVTNEIIRPAPSVLFLDLQSSGRHRAVGTHDCLSFFHHIGHTKVRDFGHREWVDWQTGSAMTGPGLGRDFESISQARMLATFIASEMVETVLECPIESARIPTISTPTTELRVIRWLLHALQDDLAAGASNGPLFAESIAVALIAAASERPISRGMNAPLPDTAVARLPDFIAAHLHESLTLSRIATETGLSLRHLTVGFRKAFGQSVHQFVLEQRVKRACRLLGMGLPIAETAAFSGFPERRSLARALRNVAGLTILQARSGCYFVCR